MRRSSAQNKKGSSSSSKGKGRQKVVLKKIEDKNNLEVTFSKRKGGFLKKASELNTLSGAEVVVVVFSPSGKPYTFGHPNLYATTNKFIGRDAFTATGGGQSFGAAQRHMNVNQEELNQLSQLEILVEAEKKIGKELDRVRDQARKQLDSSKLDYVQLEMCLDVVQKFRNNILAAKKGLNGEDKGREPLQKGMFTSPKANAPPSLANGSGSSSGLVVRPPLHGSNVHDLHDPSLGRSNFNVVPYGLGGNISWNHSDVETGGNAMALAPGSGLSSGFGLGPPHLSLNLASPNDQWAGWSSVPNGLGGHIGRGMSSGSSESNVNDPGPSGTSGGGGDGSANTSNHFKPHWFG